MYFLSEKEPICSIANMHRHYEQSPWCFSVCTREESSQFLLILIIVYTVKVNIINDIIILEIKVPIFAVLEGNH